MNKTKTKQMTADEKWHAAIQPIVDYCERNRGARSEIARLLAGHMPQPRVSEYLNADPAKRVCPQFGAGLLLLQAFEAVKDGRKK